MAIATINNVPADNHSFRVTLNILHKSTATPPDLRMAIEKLIAVDWKQSRLTDPELQQIYGHVDDDLCQKALAEWEVDTSKMRDWAYPYSRADFRDWHMSGVHSVDCRLCGHKHNRFEFPLENSNGNTIWTGSTCIQKYGIVVDGEATAEKALTLLRKVMTGSKRKQSSAAWLKLHPDHEAVIDEIREGARLCKAHLSWNLSQHVAGGYYGWRDLQRSVGKQCRAVVKYYDKNGCLTAQRSYEVWNSVKDSDGEHLRWTADGRLLREIRSMRVEYEKALANDPTRLIQKFWDDWLVKHAAVLEIGERNRVAYFKDRNIGYDSVYGYNKTMVRDVERRLSAGPKKADACTDLDW